MSKTYNLTQEQVDTILMGLNELNKLYISAGCTEQESRRLRKAYEAFED